MTFAVYEELESAYGRGDIYPLDLKNAVAEALGKACRLSIMLVLYCYCTAHGSHTEEVQG